MRLLCFGDSYASVGRVSDEYIAQGHTPSWCSLLADRLGCAVITKGVKGTGPAELIDQLTSWQDFAPNDNVICTFSNMRHFCLTPNSPSLFLGLNYKDEDDSYAVGVLERVREYYSNFSMAKLHKVFEVFNQYEKLLNNQLRVDMMQRVYATALEGIAANNPDSKFYVMYSLPRDWASHTRLNIRFNNVKLIPGYIEQWSGNHRKTLDSRYTNHFTVDTVHKFVDFLSENIA